MGDGWEKLEYYLDKKINFQFKLVELFLLSISASIIIISLSKYKLIIFSTLLQILALIWVIVLILIDLHRKKTKESNGLLKKYAFVITIPFSWKELIPIIIYIISILGMAIILLLPYFNF
jgi:hypothetical protein